MAKEIPVIIWTIIRLRLAYYRANLENLQQIWSNQIRSYYFVE